MLTAVISDYGCFFLPSLWVSVFQVFYDHVCVSPGIRGKIHRLIEKIIMSSQFLGVSPENN